MAAGFLAQRIDCSVSHWGQGYAFTPRHSEVDLESLWLPAKRASGWHGNEPGGRWTREHATLVVDTETGASEVLVALVNYHPCDQPVVLRLGEATHRMILTPGESRSVALPCVAGAHEL